MKNYTSYAQFYLRLALGIGFILPVMDRTGVLGPAGQNNVSWGTWENFLSYTHALLPFLSKSASDIFGLLATIAEAVFGVLLIIGYKTRLTAVGSCLLTLSFALCMAIFTGFKAPFNYSVFPVSAGSLLLSAIPYYKWSIDNSRH
jgi:putative oxidoreductase